MKIYPQNRIDRTLATVEAKHSAVDIPADWLDHPLWEQVEVVRITRYWSGADATEERHAEARVLWSHAALHVRFRCNQGEQLVVNPSPQTETKCLGLWDRDVCEIFVAPDPRFRYRYFEFEAAPTGEWVDLAVQNLSNTRETDYDFNSGMTAAGKIIDGGIIVAMRIPWSISLPQPKSGQKWRANLYRCVGSGEDRGYLAWQPTRTAKPDFHVPDSFGELIFT